MKNKEIRGLGKENTGKTGQSRGSERSDRKLGKITLKKGESDEKIGIPTQSTMIANRPIQNKTET